MNTIYKILLLLLLASALSLSSCVNQVKDGPKTQVQDTTKVKDSLSRLAIVFNIPDPNNILTVTFHASLTPSLQQSFRLDWDFGDSSGIMSRFDTISLVHNFKNFGSYIVTLSVIDTQTKILVRKVFDTLLMLNNPIDTNYLHEFTKVYLAFSGARQYDTGSTITDFDMMKCNHNFSNINWSGNSFNISCYNSWDYWNKPNSNPESWSEYTGSESTHILGQISVSGNKIDSCSDVFNHGESNTIPHEKEYIYKGHIFRFQSLPILKKDSNQIVFVLSGKNLHGVIQQFADSSYNSLYSDNYRLETILWDQLPTPTLTVTFTK